MTSPAGRSLSYRPELDGVRAVAVLAVLAFHIALIVPSWQSHIRNGFLGVDIFFVLSGMLITELIVADHLATNAASLRRFYERRARRLLPALIVFVIVTPIYFQLSQHGGKQTIQTFVSVVTQVNAGHEVYPWSIGVSQVWTLVIEWEFYLIWPVLLIAGLRKGIAPRKLGYAAAAAAIAITVVRACIFQLGGHNFDFSYYLAWLRFDELLVGCALGLLGGRPQAPNWLRWVAVVWIGLLLVHPLFAERRLFTGETFGLAVATALIIQPRTKPWIADRILGSAPMVWIGKLSYSLYLWSATVIFVLGRHTAGWSSAERVLMSIVASFALAIPSYYLVERRFRLPSRRADIAASQVAAAD